MSEAKTFTPVLQDGGVPGQLAAPVPATPAAVIAYGGTFKAGGGHVEWIDSKSTQSGFTTTFPPNTPVLYTSGGTTYDIDFCSRREGKTATLPTYSAVTARSYHPGGVNVLLMDGSGRFVANAITPALWQALGTRAGGEVVAEF
jgi:prepilin-type processing-associated H-X9-DG protein